MDAILADLGKTQRTAVATSIFAVVPRARANARNASYSSCSTFLVRGLSLLRRTPRHGLTVHQPCSRPYANTVDSSDVETTDWRARRRGRTAQRVRREGTVVAVPDPYPTTRSRHICRSKAVIVRPAKAGASSGSQSHRGKSRSPVAWVAGLQWGNRKPTDNAIVRMAASHQGVAQANERWPRNFSLGGRAGNDLAKAAWIIANRLR